MSNSSFELRERASVTERAKDLAQRAAEVAVDGVDLLRQSVYREFSSEISALSDTRAGATQNPYGEPCFDKLDPQRGNASKDLYVKQMGENSPRLVVRNSRKGSESSYWIEATEDGDQLKGLKQTVEFRDGQEIAGKPQKLSIREAGKYTQVMQDLNAAYYGLVAPIPTRRLRI